MDKLTSILITFFATVVPAIAGFLVVFFQEKANRLKIKNLEEMLKNGTIYYIECPKCNTKIYLKDVKIMEEK